jgi:hypothetical protein
MMLTCLMELKTVRQNARVNLLRLDHLIFKSCPATIRNSVLSLGHQAANLLDGFA